MENDRLNMIDIVQAVHRCVHGECAGSLLSTAKAIEQLRMISGDFVTSDDEMANAIARVAIKMGCTVVFDEQPVLTP